MRDAETLALEYAFRQPAGQMVWALCAAAADDGDGGGDGGGGGEVWGCVGNEVVVWGRGPPPE